MYCRTRYGFSVFFVYYFDAYVVLMAGTDDNEAVFGNILVEGCRWLFLGMVA